jgi:signal transduction histidine kinase
VFLRPPWLTGATALFGATITAVIALVAPLHFAYRSASLHAAIETAAAIAALLAASLVFGRFREHSRLNDLALVAALSVLATTNLAFAALPAALPDAVPGTFSTWSAVIGSVLGSVLLAVAAFAPATRVRHPRGSAVVVFVTLAGLLGIMTAVIATFAAHLPVGIEQALPSGELQLEEHGAVLAAQVASAVCLAIAAVGFTLRTRLPTDELLRWLAVGATLGAVARINFALFPSLYSQWVSTGDIFRMGFYVALLIGAEREIRLYQSRMAALAVLEERRRLARELHDGLAHELVFIATQARRLEQEPDLERLPQIVTAAERAIDESRRAIGALTRPMDEPFDIALAATAEDVASRLGARLELELATDVDVSPETCEALLRVVREAITNAARHGRAGSIRVTLANGHGLRLRIADDGIGFDPVAVKERPGAFGLTSMRERVQALGGEFRLFSQPGAGTSIDVVLL